MEDLTARASGPPAFPFTAVPGMEAAKEALLLLAVEPRLKGVLFAAGTGSGKTILVRGWKALVSTGNGVPFVEVPLHATEDSLLGALDLENTLRTGTTVFSSGILARADRGFLFVDNVNHLPRTIAVQVAQALDRGVVQVERDNLSGRYPSRFRLVGTYTPNEGAISAALLESAGIHVHDHGRLSRDDTMTMLRRVEEFQRAPADFIEEYSGATEQLKTRIAAARELLPDVCHTSGDLRLLSSAALELGVEGHRADTFAVCLSRARAALMARAAVTSEDLEAAVRLVLEPRSTDRAGSQAQPPPGKSRERQEGEDRDGASAALALIEAAAVDCPAPPGALAHGRPDAGEAGGRGRGRKAVAEGPRGRYKRAVSGPRPGGTVALEATLRAAAPFQLLRRQAQTDGQDGGSQANVVRITSADLRFKHFQSKTGLLIVFAVDASGSMAMNRINLAKGAMLRLLREAYVHRDKIALVGFRGSGAQVLLPPGRSVDLARRAVEEMRIGEGTPLAAGLQKTLDVIRRERNSGFRSALLVLFTDAGANVPVVPANEVWSEIEAVSGSLRREGAEAVVIDTTARHLATGRAERLAALLGGRHLRLPPADGGAVSGALAGIAGELRGKR